MTPWTYTTLTDPAPVRHSTAPESWPMRLVLAVLSPDELRYLKWIADGDP